MKVIGLSQGKEALVDDSDYEYLYLWSWYFGSKGYAQRSENGLTILMHREVAKRMGIPVTSDVDHEDTNRLNNQRLNLRPATDSQNQANARIRTDNTSGFKGVYFDRRANKWKGQIRVRKCAIYLGLFDSPIDAARAYNKAALRYFGEFAKLNEIP